VAKASLYNYFASKEELVAAYLASRHDHTAGRITNAIETTDDPRQKILAVFDAQAKQYEQPDFHGCAFIAASTEAPRAGWSNRPLTTSERGCARCSPIWRPKWAAPTRSVWDANSTSSTTVPDWPAAWTITTRESARAHATPWGHCSTTHFPLAISDRGRKCPPQLVVDRSNSSRAAIKIHLSRQDLVDAVS
jgi:AcrR family transcriptional regulator